MGCPAPPISEASFTMPRGRILQIDGRKNSEPELSCEHTSCKNVLHIFLFLITEHTLRRVGKAPLCKPIHCPASITYYKP
uniref:Uncharacterized protein n=1 Tax=Arundo donax TaxID=35708 RepID=A0A0A9BXI5_ARUDO